MKIEHQRCPVLLAASVAVLFLLCLAAASRAEFYKYTDENGDVYFVDDLTQVPPEYRPQMETYRERHEGLPEEDRERLLETERRQALENQQQIELQIERFQSETAAEEKRQRELDRQKASRRSETPVQIEDNRILVPVSVSNAGVEVTATLLLDTGASHTVLHRDRAESLGIVARAKGYAKTAGGQSVYSELGVVDALKVGPVVMKNAPVLVLDHQGPPVGYDGLLGMTFLSRVHYSIDYDRQVIDWQVR